MGHVIHSNAPIDFTSLGRHFDQRRGMNMLRQLARLGKHNHTQREQKHT